MRIAVRDRARWIAAAFLIVLLVPIMPAHSRAATLFTVSTTSDSGGGSLRDAITHATATPGATIAFAIPGTGVQTITLATALPTIAAKLTIDATTQPGYSGTPLIVIDGNNSVTDITVNNGANARLRGLNITRGHGSTGGGVLNNGTLTLDLSSVTNSSAVSGPVSGGGIYNNGALIVIGSTISGNSADSGAGIFSTGTLTLTASTVNANTASGRGGGLLITGRQSQTIINSTITGNTAASGGGIDNQGALAITNSTITANHASVMDGGGIKVESRGVGVTVTNTIIADNSCITPTDDVSGTFTSGGHNLIGFTGISIGFDATLGDLLNPPRAGVSPTLADNGGPTQTLALQNSSPAIGAGDPALCAATPVSGYDQRGVARLFNRCAIGAFEYRLAQSVSVASSSAPIVVGGTTQFTATVTFTDTSTQDITAAANWRTGDSAKATAVSGFTSANPGLVTGTGAGMTSVSARFGGASDSGSVTVTTPTPAITSLTPSTVTTTSGTIALTVTGSGFVPSSVVHFASPTVSDTALTTTYLSGTQVQATIPGGDLTATGTARITVVNPPPGGASNAQPLTLTPGSAIRLVVSGFPPATTAGASHPLTVTAKDSLGNIVTSDNDTLSLSSSDFSATLPLTGMLMNGVGIFPITLKTAGTQTIVAADLGPRTIVATQSGITVTPASPASITASSGTTPQSAQVGHAFAIPFAVIVQDAFGNAVPNTTVTFSQPANGASGAFAAPATVTTNSSGGATAPTFTANATAGAYAVIASASGVGTPALFALTNLPGPPGSIIATAGSAQRAAIGGTFAHPFVALVKDASGNPVGADTSVTFTAPASGASGTFVGGALSATVQTAADGTATSPVFKANTVAGSYGVTASAPGVTAPATFTLSNTPGPAAAITPDAGAGQSAPVTMAFSTALAAKVTDASGNPVPNVTVTFAAPASGASATFAGGTTTATTNNSGVATAVTVTANGIAGSYTVTATTAGIAGNAAFTLTNLPGPVAHFALVPAGTASSAARNAKNVAPAATASVQSGVSLAMTVTALDANRNIVTGYTGTIHFTSSDPHAVLPLNYPFTLADDGVHSFTLAFNSAGTQTVTVADTAGGPATGSVAITVIAAPVIVVPITPVTPAPIMPAPIAPAPVAPTPSTPPITKATTPAPTPTAVAPKTPSSVPGPAIQSAPVSLPDSVALPAPTLPVSGSGLAAVTTPFSPLASFTDTSTCRFFAETHHALCNGFLAYWQQHGGIALSGMPISEEFQERGEDGTMRTVQYLERARYEYHPEFKGTPYEVELGLLARETTATRINEPPFAPSSAESALVGARFFAETRHTLADPFMTYWDANGGLPIFGFPISEPFREQNADTGQTYLVQYFERYRLEFHPDSNAVEVGRLGVQEAQMRGYMPH